MSAYLCLEQNNLMNYETEQYIYFSKSDKTYEAGINYAFASLKN